MLKHDSKHKKIIARKEKQKSYFFNDFISKKVANNYRTKCIGEVLAVVDSIYN